MKKVGLGRLGAAGSWLALWFWSTLAAAGPNLGAVGPANPAPQDSSARLGLDLSPLSKDGLYGPGDGRRALHYEFCIPQGDDTWCQVAAIDPSAKAMAGSRGRIGCGLDQVLVLGNTHQPGFAAALQAPALLPFIHRIEPVWFE